MENNDELYELTNRILVDGEQIVFNPLNPTISIGLTYGIFKKGEDGVEISNKIFEEIIYNYMISKIRTSAKNMSLYNVKSSFIKNNGELDMLIREIEEKDNEQVESLIRTCLIEFGANKPGCAWTDPNLGCFYQVYQNEKSK